MRPAKRLKEPLQDAVAPLLPQGVLVTPGQHLSLPQTPLRTKVALGMSPGCHQASMWGREEGAQRSLTGAENYASFLYLRWATQGGSGPNSHQTPFPPTHT